MILTRLYEHAQRLQDKLPIEGLWRSQAELVSRT